MPPRLDMDRNDVGQIHPPEDGAMWEQDGHLFSGSGEYLRTRPNAPRRPNPMRDKMERLQASTAAAPLPGGADATDPNRIVAQPLQKPLTAAERLAKAKRELAEAEAAMRDEEDDNGEETEDEDHQSRPGTTERRELDDEPKSTTVKPSEVDLAAWAAGTKKYAFFVVKKRVVAEFGDKIDATNSATIKAGLTKLGAI